MSTDTITNISTIAQINITADGTALTSTELDSLVFAETEQTMFLPAMATLRFYNAKLTSTMATKFGVGKTVEIKMGQSSTTLASVFSGEVVALDLDYAPTATAMITVRAYDKSHRLMRGRKTRTFIDVKDSDLVSQLAGEAGLTPGADTTTSVFKWLIQNNETTYEFLLRRALRIGFEMFVDATTLKFRKPTPSVAGVAVTWGEELLDFKVRVSATKQIDKASVRGWDRKTKQAIVGQATSATLLQTITASADGGATAKKAFTTASFDGLYRYVQDQTEAQNVAQAVLDDVNARYVQCEGRCLGNSAIKIGTNIEIKGIDTDYKGKYYLTSVSHRFEVSGGYSTHFESNGKNTNTIIEMTNQVNQNGGGPMSPIVGVVTKVKDAQGDNMGRIKVKFPTLGDTIESDWIPILTPMTGNGYGLHFMPEVNDEVLIAFANGDIGDAYMLGGIWNGTDKPPLDNTSADVVGGDGKVNQRVIKSRSGHIVTFNDSDDKPGISVVDKTGNNKITINSASGSDKISIETAGDMLIKATKKITIEAADLDVTVTNKITEKGGTVAQESTTANFTVKAAVNFEAKASAAAKIEGATLEAKGSASAKIDGGAMTEVKGGLIKLN